jgi:hypothetical protein
MKKFWIKLNGRSMSPLILDQDNILIVPFAPGDEIKCGDIVLLFESLTQQLVLHRYIDKLITTKGDFSICSEKTSPEICLGRAVAFQRENRFCSLTTSESFITQLFIFFSRLRMRGLFVRKFALVGLITLTKGHEFYNDKTSLSHSEVLCLADL